MTALLYKIPEELILRVQTGGAEIVGAIIKDSVSGKILAHVQPTGVMEQMIGAALRGTANTLSQGLNPIGIVTAIQNEQIKSRLSAMGRSLSLIQNIQIGTIAVSGIGLGVSVVGFAVMLKRLNSIEKNITDLSDRIDAVTAARRRDEVAGIFADISADLDTIDTLEVRRDPSRVAEAAQLSLARSASQLKTRFEQITDQDKLTMDQLELLWSLAAAIRLCSDAGLKALVSIEELQAAAMLMEKNAERFATLSAPLSPDRIARICVSSVGQGEVVNRARKLTGALRESARQTASQSLLATHLIKKGQSGRQYLEEAQKEKEEPLLVLPA